MNAAFEPMEADTLETRAGMLPEMAAKAVQLICGASIKPQRIDWLWPDWLAAGKLHILAGAPGTGKTTLALALAAEARQGFSIKAREHEPDAEQWLAEADQLIRELTSELPARATAYDMESLQLD